MNMPNIINVHMPEYDEICPMFDLKIFVFIRIFNLINTIIIVSYI